jgi:hypothetical protein
MERNGEATPPRDELGQLTPEELEVYNGLSRGPNPIGMDDVEYAKFLTRMYKEMDDEPDWVRRQSLID